MASKIHLINCQFANNAKSNKLIQIIQNKILKRFNNLIIIIVSCIFHNNKYIQILSVNCWSRMIGKQRYSILLWIKNTTLSSNTYYERPLIYFYRIKAKIHQIKVISNTGLFEADSSTIVTAEDSYLQFQWLQ